VAEPVVPEAGSSRVAEAVKRALLLVGPSESGFERVAGEQPAEETAV
jgi:hypothetical protein